MTLELRLLVWWPAAIERLAYLCLTLSTRLCSRISDKTKTNGPVPILFPNPRTPLVPVSNRIPRDPGP